MIRAMIVDDEQLSIDKMYKLLRESGKVEIRGEYTDAGDALKSLKTEHVDVIFLDTHMPAANVFELANKIIGIQESAAIVFICPKTDSHFELLQAHGLNCLSKPLQKEELKSILGEVEKSKITVSGEKTTLTVHCFGRFRVAAGNRVIRFPTAKTEELLTYFMGNYGRAIHKDEIVSRLWGEDAEDITETFNLCFFSLKRLLLQSGISIRVECDGGYFRVEIDRLVCDYYKFKLFMSEPLEINEHTIRDFDEMIALYTADYLSENEYHWAKQKRKFIRGKYIELSLLVFRYYKAKGDAKRAVEVLQCGLKEEPLNRELNFQLMRTYKDIHEIVALYKHFEKYKRSLKTESGAEPDNEIKKLL